MITIYALTDNDVIFYIGQTMNLAGRFSYHKSECVKQKTTKQKRIFDVISNGRKLSVLYLEECHPDIATKRELYYVQYYINKGYKLTNKNLINTGKFFIPQKRKVDNTKLSSKQLKVLNLICNDYTTPEIAKLIKLSVRQTELIRQQIKKICKVKTIAGLVGYAYRNKLAM